MWKRRHEIDSEHQFSTLRGEGGVAMALALREGDRYTSYSWLARVSNVKAYLLYSRLFGKENTKRQHTLDRQLNASLVDREIIPCDS